MKHLFQLSLLLLAFLLPATAFAHDFEVDGIYYNINGNEATVTRSPNYNYSGNVTIPATVTFNSITYSVTSIGERAFDGCRGLTSVTIPNSVTSIGSYAFHYCRALTSIDVPNSVISIGEWAFSYCSDLTSVTIPNSVSSVGYYAFFGTAWYNNQPDGLVYAGLVAYEYKGTMPSGTSIIIRDGTLGIAGGAFEWCTDLTSITIPNSVINIGVGAFWGCSGLTSVTIPNSVTYIGDYAFEECINLADIVIPDYVSYIGSFAFDNTEWYYNQPSGLIYIGKNAYRYNGDYPENTRIVIKEGTLGISPYSFGVGNFAKKNINTLSPKDVIVSNQDEKAQTPYSGLISIELPNSVKTIGEAAFGGCSGLSSVTIGDSVTSIGSMAFRECAALINIDLPNSVTSIGDNAFSGCTGLTSITIPNSVTTIADYTFIGCTSLASVTIPNSVTSIGNEVFGDCHSLTSVIIPNSVTFIRNAAFSGCSGLTEIYSLALTPPTMYSSSFSGCYEATLYVPDIALESYKATDYWKEFTNIVGMPYTFEVDGTNYHATTMNTANVMANNDNGLLYNGDIVIPDSVTYEGYTFAVTGIEGNAFDGCFELTSITIPNSIETIGEQAFQGCTGLKSVTIGSGVTAIGAKAFNYCNALETVKCLGTVPPVMASTDCFSTAAYNRAQLLVPRNTEATYTAADHWYKFAHIDGWGSAGRGDIDGDGVVSINDVTSMIDAILTGDYEGIYFESADVNINGRLDIGDVTTIIDMLLNDIR